jgi:hypothetical protein
MTLMPKPETNPIKIKLTEYLRGAEDAARGNVNKEVYRVFAAYRAGVKDTYAVMFDLG